MLSNSHAVTESLYMDEFELNLQILINGITGYFVYISSII